MEEPSPLSRKDVTAAVKSHALQLGFTLVGVSPAEELPDERAHLMEWLDNGFHGSMDWMEKRRAERGAIHRYFPDAKSVISVAINYFTTPAPSQSTECRISNYAHGDDYHDLLKRRLYQLLERIQEMMPVVSHRICVDSSPVMDKVWARQSGLGWIGKHTNVINRSHGSWLFLGELILDQELEYDHPEMMDYCGNCTACLDACPTQAFPAPYVLDARKCISYQTIENRKDVPEEIVEELGGWIYGCDICQQVCPWNIRFGHPTQERSFHARPGIAALTSEDWKQMPEEAFRRIFKGTPIRRTGHSRMQRNVSNALKAVENPTENK